jgi:hypothetical protein
MHSRDIRPDGERSLTPPSEQELLEARERADAGFRLALPHLAERLGLGAKEAAQTKATIDHQTATRVGTKLLEAHEAVMDAALELPLEGQMDLHLAFNGLVNELDRISQVLAERWGSE